MNDENDEEKVVKKLLFLLLKDEKLHIKYFMIILFVIKWQKI